MIAVSDTNHTGITCNLADQLGYVRFQCELNACSFQLHLTQDSLSKLPATPATALLLATDSRCSQAESLVDITALAAAVREYGLSDKDSVM